MKEVKRYSLINKISKAYPKKSCVKLINWFEKNPKEFNPDRFENCKYFTSADSGYFPFGYGARSCIGGELAQIDLKEILLNEFNLKSCEIIEYGGDHVSCETINSEFLLKYPFLNEKFYFSLGRCQSDNNQHLLLESFKELPNSFLVAVSNWDHNTYGKSLREKYSNYSNIIMLDPIYNQKEIDVLRSNSYVYIHSHSQCGTAPSLVEAMNLDNAIISFDVATNRVTTNNKAFYFNDKKSLISIIENTSVDEIDENRKVMNEISKTLYTWNRISKLYSNLFIN